MNNIFIFLMIIIIIIIITIIIIIISTPTTITFDFVKQMETFKSQRGDAENLDEQNSPEDDIYVLSYDNENPHVTNTKNLIFLLHYFQFPHIKICGQGQPWTGWAGRMKSYISELSLFPNKSAYVVVCDGRDVLVNNTYSTFQTNALALYKEAGNKIIFGAERYCIFNYCNDVHKYIYRKYKVHQCGKYATEDFYLNFGLAFGQVSQFLSLFESFNTDKPKFDDQEECAVANEKEQQFFMDYKQIIFGNTFNTDGDCTLRVLYDKEDAILEFTKYNTTPAFMHFPGKDECYYAAMTMMEDNILSGDDDDDGDERG